VAVATTLWPIVWPSPERVTLGVFTGASSLALPVRKRLPEDDRLPAFLESEGATPMARTVLRAGRSERRIERDLATGETVFHLLEDLGTQRLDWLGLEIDFVQRETTRIQSDDPNSMSMETAYSIAIGRGDWRTRTETRTLMRSTPDEFLLDATLDAYEGEVRVLSREWTRRVPRDGV
jgi:hypothetical protein